MRTMTGTLALLSLAAGPVFAAGAYGPQSAQFGYYGINGHNRLGLPSDPGQVNIPNPSGGIPGA